MTPLLVELMTLFFPHISIVIVAVHLVADSLLDDLAALVVEHPLVASFLQPRGLVIIHLLPLNDFVAVPDSSSHFVLVLLLHRSAVRVEFGRADEGLLDEVPVAIARTHIGTHGKFHLVSHIIHHLIHTPESTVCKEGIIAEWVSHH
jgi:hypothetical protein